MTCVFCNEVESCQHLFFDCVVASNLWKEMGLVLGIQPQFKTMTDISAFWRDKKRHVLYNMICADTLSSIGITRNDMVFSRSQWFGIHVLWRKVVYNCAQWKILLKEEEKGSVIAMLDKLELLARLPPMLSWPEPG
jgi:hypothetical protein